MKPRIRSVDTVPIARRQRSINDVWPKDATGYHHPDPEPDPTQKPGRHTPGTLGRFPTIGIDEGALKHTRPDTSPINGR